MVYKKKCECGFVVNAASVKGAIDGIHDHCIHSGCNAMNAKNV